MSAVTDFFHSLGPAPQPNQLGPLSNFLGPSTYLPGGLPNVNFGPPSALSASNENLTPSSSPLFDIGGPLLSDTTVGSPSSSSLSLANLFSQPSVDSSTGQIAQPVDQASIDAASASLNSPSDYNFFNLNPVSTDINTASESLAAPRTSDFNALGMNPPQDLSANPSFNSVMSLLTPDGSTPASADQATVNSSQFFTTAFNIVGTFFTRTGLVLLAIVIIGLGLWAMLSKSKIGVTIRENVGKAASAAAAA